MEEEIAAYIHKRAPGEKHGEWHQRGLKRVLSRWKTSESEKYNIAIMNQNFASAVGYRITPTALGQYGYDTEFHFEPNLDPHFLEEVPDATSLCKEFYDAWVREIQEVIKEDQESSLFTPKELATLYAYHNPKQNEKKAADALDIKVGTYRGKVGRVKEKLSTARASLALDKPAQVDSEEEWWRDGYSAPLTVIDRVDEGRLPVDAAHDIIGADIHEWPVNDLIR